MACAHWRKCVSIARSRQTSSAISRSMRPSRSRCRADAITPLEYNDDGSVSVSVKLQELFGLAETPRIGRQREPVVLALLAPNGRPVQVTRDLRSFWDRTYPEVQKGIARTLSEASVAGGSWSAPPTARTKES